MAGKLDEISRAIGSIETGVKALSERADDDRDLAERRHEENQAAIGGLRQDTQRSMSELSQTATDRWTNTTDTLNELRRDVLAHAAAVSAIDPQVAALQILRGRLILFASLGVLVIFAIGHAIQSGLSAAVTWGLNKIH